MFNTLDLPEERGLYTSMKVGEQCLYLAQMKGLSKAEATETVELWFERLEIQGWWNKKIQDFLKVWLKKFSLSFVYKPKLILTSLFWF
jgi:ABC-2 type transport system ATP-binding protein